MESNFHRYVASKRYKIMARWLNTKMSSFISRHLEDSIVSPKGWDKKRLSGQVGRASIYGAVHSGFRC